MRPQERRKTAKQDVAGARLDQIVDTNHALVKLASIIDWRLLEERFGQATPDEGRPLPARLIVGLSILKQLYDLSDEIVCTRWVENPYFQYFCGEQIFQHNLTFDQSSVTQALQRFGAGKLRALVQASLNVDAGNETIKSSDLSRLGIDTSILPKDLVLPTTGLLAGDKSRPIRKIAGGEAQKPVSIYDVAKRAGVSIKTVSLVINRQPNVSKQTRSAVLAAINALSYRPNVFARGLASERSYLIGLMYDNPSVSYVGDLQFGALAACRDEGYHLIVELLNAQDADLGQRVRKLLSESVLHGVVLTPPLCDAPAVIEELIRAQTRFVRIAPGTEMPGAPTISIDEHRAAYDVTRYLLGLGHRRIGFIKGHPDHGASHARLEGYRTALAEANLPFSEELCAPGLFSYQSGMDAAEYLLSLKNRPTAIFAGNDDMAAGVLAVSQRFNLKIPEQLSVAGFDDSLVSQVVWPQLTTCRQPVKEMAAAAISILVQKPHEGAPLERHMGHQLVVRGSTAPPAA